MDELRSIYLYEIIFTLPMELFYLFLGSLIFLAAFHMIAPDHWIPISTISSIKKFSNLKRIVVSILLGVLHASTSVAVAAAAMAIGLAITKSYLSYLYDAGEVLLVMVGLYFILNGLRERKKNQKLETVSTNSALAVSIFPDFALVPILISATPLGFLEISILIIVFVSVSALSLTVIVLVASVGITSAIEKFEPRIIDYVMGIVLFSMVAILRFL